jgi:hypothetical protein
MISRGLFLQGVPVVYHGLAVKVLRGCTVTLYPATPAYTHSICGPLQCLVFDKDQLM